jgi:hypothetical protein
MIGGNLLLTWCLILSIKDCTLIILGSWYVWKHQNTFMFNGKSPSHSTTLIMVRNGLFFWKLAGAKGLSLLIDLA